MNDTIQPLVDEIRAAEILNIAPGTLRNQRALGIGPAYVKLRGSVRYRMSDLRSYVEARVRRPVIKPVRTKEGE